MLLLCSRYAWAHVPACLLLLEVCLATMDQQDIKQKPEASLGDVLGAMGGLMTAFAPQKDAEGILLYIYYQKTFCR